MTGSFVKKFKIKNKYYIYDVHTNHIVEVDKIIYGIVDEIESENDFDNGNLKNRLIGKKYPINKIDELYSLNEKYDLFKASRPRKISPFYTFDYFHRNIKNNLSQLILCVTEACNMRCNYCVYSDKYPSTRVHRNKKMNEDVAFQAVDYFLEKSKKQTSISFYGGEPLLNIQLIKKVVSYVNANYKQKNIRYNLTTNGTLLNDENSAFLIENGFSISVSIDGPQAIHDKHRVYSGNRGTYDIIMKNLAQIKEKFPKSFKKIMIIATVAPPYDIMALYNFFRLPFFKGAGNVRWNTLNLLDNTINKYIKSDENYYNKSLSTLKRILKIRLAHYRPEKDDLAWLFLFNTFMVNLLQIHQRPRSMLGRNARVPGPCIPGVRKYYVSVDGDYHICEKLDYSNKIGDYKNGLDEDKIEAIIKEYYRITEHDCKNCWALRMCNMCFVHAYTGKGVDPEYKNSHCRLVREGLLYYLKFYTELMAKDEKVFDKLKYEII